MHDFIAAVQSAPLWAQIGMVFFAILVVVMVVEPGIRNRRARRQFDALARGVGVSPPAGRGCPVMFPITIDDRAFEVRHDFQGRTSGGSYRGPTGLLLITATRLTGERWPMHQVDIAALDKRFAWLFKSKRLSGDLEFDARFLVVEDGVPARERWLDEETRRAIERVYTAAPIPGLIWIREGELRFIIQSPWTGVDGPGLRALLERQAALAATLDRTAARQARNS